MKLRLDVFAGVLGAVLLSTSAANAELIITFSQAGPNVTASGTGSLNFLDLSFSNFDLDPPFVDASSGAVLLDTVPATFTDVYVGAISGPTSFGAGGSFGATSGASTAPNSSGAGINGALGELFVPGGYTANSPFTVDATWDGTTIAGLGLTPGTYTWTWGGDGNADSLEVIIPIATSVPEPSSVALLLAGLSMISGAMYFARKKMAAEA